MPQERRSHKEKERRKDKERHERDKASSCGFAECSMLVVLSTTFDWQREMHTVCGRARSVTPRPCRNWSESSRRKRRRSNIALQGMHPGMKPGALRCVLSFFFSLSLSPSLLLPSFKKRIDEIWHILYTWFDSYVYSQHIYVLILQDFFLLWFM